MRPGELCHIQDWHEVCGKMARWMETYIGHKYQGWRTTFQSQAVAQIPLRPVGSGWKKVSPAHKEKIHIWILFYPRAKAWPCAKRRQKFWLFMRTAAFTGSLHRWKKPHSASSQWKGTVGKPGLPPEPPNKPYLKLDSMPSGVDHTCSRVALGPLSSNITFRRESRTAPHIPTPPY